MKKILNILILSLTTFISCDNNDEQSCSNPAWIIDDCGICRECETIECDWNASQDDCEICFGDNSGCSGCMDSLAINYDETSIFHIPSTYIHNEIFIHLSESTNSNEINIEPDYINNIRPEFQRVWFRNFTLETLNIYILGNDTISLNPGAQQYKIFNEGYYQYQISDYSNTGIIIVQSYD